MAYFLLRNMDQTLRDRLEEDADEIGESLQEMIRRVLCEHYELDCSEIKGTPRESTRRDAATVLIRMQTELFQAVKVDSEETGESMRTLVLDALEARYVTDGRKR